MSVYVNVKCGKCGKSVTEGYTVDYNVIGSPIFDCPNCGAINRHDNKSTEWELMSPSRRSRWMILIIAQTIMFAGFGGFVLVAVLAAGDMIESSAVAIVLFLAIIAGALFYRKSRISAIVDASKQRMKDQNYRRKLRSAGIDA